MGRPLPADDPRRRQPLIARAQDTLGWSPRTALSKGLRATIDYFSLKVLTPKARLPHENGRAHLPQQIPRPKLPLVRPGAEPCPVALLGPDARRATASPSAAVRGAGTGPN